MQIAHRPRRARFHRKPVGPIVGGVVGGAGALFLLLGALLFWRWRKGKSEEHRIRYIMETTTVPYTEVQPRPYLSAADRKESARSPPITVEPLIPPVAATATTGEIQERHRDAAITASSGSAQVQPGSTQPEPRVETVAETDDIDAIPGLVERLNRIRERLPPGWVIEEQPPAYHPE